MRCYFVNILGQTFRSSFTLFIGVLLVCFYGIWLLSADARRELDKLARRGANRCNGRWRRSRSNILRS